MASPPGPPPLEHSEPQGQIWHWSVIVDGKQYTYGGDFGAGGSPPLSTVETFDLVTEQWQQMPTTGEAPPGHMNSSCAAVGTHIHHFGGRDKEYRYYNTIHCLEISQLTWRATPAVNPHEAPMLKGGAAMLVYGNTLVISGGYGVLPQNPNPNKYIPDPDYEEGQGYTNEVHCFHVDSSELC